MKRTTRLATAVSLACATLSAPAFAATELQKQTAIQNGLEWIAANQQGDGSWNYGDSYGNTAATGAALLALQEQKAKTGGWFGKDYSSVVAKGYQYLMSNAQTVNIGPQAAGNPDTNGNGKGVKFVLGGDNGRDTYVTGLVLPALAKYGNLNDTITVGSQTGRTYAQVIQDTVDYFAWGQNDSGYGRGAWRYYENSGDSDNSTAQWPVVGMLYAQAAGATVPTFVKTELKTWIDYIQNPNGGSGYNTPDYLVNESKTGGLLVEMAFAGYDGYKAGDTLGKQQALDFLDANWQNVANGWDGNFGHPYAMWGVYKGLQLTIGLGNTTEITNLHAPGTMDPGDVWNWWEDYADYLVKSQSGDGSWPDGSNTNNWRSVLATPWYINILNATEIDDGGDVPEPGTLMLLGAGLLGGLAIRRRRQGS